MNKKIDVAEAVLNHPDREEIISKLTIGISTTDIAEWLSCKYEDVAERKFMLSEKTISTFHKEFFDFYQIMKNDLPKASTLSPTQEMNATLANNPTYQTALASYANEELDIKLAVRRAVAAVETRAAQVFDLIQEDPRNVKMDRALIEWFNTLFSISEKFDNIQNGTTGQVNIQNNINIQVVDRHINVICNLITEILAKIDLDASLFFIDRFNEEMQKLSIKDNQPLPIDVRLNEAKSIEAVLSSKLDK